MDLVEGLATSSGHWEEGVEGRLGWSMDCQSKQVLYCSAQETLAADFGQRV